VAGLVSRQASKHRRPSRAYIVLSDVSVLAAGT
jgi:hypothetical protein